MELDHIISLSTTDRVRENLGEKPIDHSMCQTMSQQNLKQNLFQKAKIDLKYKGLLKFLKVKSSRVAKLCA